MEIKISTQQILEFLHILSWILFLGLCVEAGSFIFNAIFTMAVNPNGAGYFGLSDLYEYDYGYFLVELLVLSIPAIMKAILFYLIVTILQNTKVDIAQPFNKEMGRFMFNVCYLAFGIGLFSFCGVNYTEWLMQQGVKMPEIQHLHIAGGDVWLFMSVVLYVIAQIFKRGIEMQSENELTI